MTKPQARAARGEDTRVRFGAMAGLSVLTLTFLFGAWAAKADEVLTKSHGFKEFGELKYDADFKHLDYVNPDAPKGGEISIWFPGTFDSFNPYSRKGRGGRLASIATERLMAATADEIGAVYCLVCETIEYPESRDYVIFNLRKDVTFSDGSPATAEDVKFSFDLLIEQGLPSFSNGVKKLIPSVEILDTHRVKFNFGEGVPRRGLISQAGSSPVFSKAWYEANNARLDEVRLDPGLGTGPYKLDSYDINRRIVYTRNPDYWGLNHPLMKGKSNYDSIRVEYFADTTAALEGFKSGAYTFRSENSSKTWATAYDFPALEKGWVKKVELPNKQLPLASGFVFNLRREKFQDIRVREALSLMFNFTWTNESLQYGLFAQRNSFWENNPNEATGVPEGAELALLESLGDLIRPEILTDPVVNAHESGPRQLDRRNLRRASKLMEDAGYKVGDDGLLRKDGRTFDLEFLEDTPSFDRIITPYIDNLKRLGVNARYNRVDPSQMTNRRRETDFDMIFHSYQTSEQEGVGTSQWFGSEDAEYSLFNPAGFAHPGADRLMELIVEADTLEDLTAATRALDRVMRAERFIVPVWFNDTFWVAYYDQFEHPETLPPYDLGYLDFWWYDAEKAEALKAAGALR